MSIRRGDTFFWRALDDNHLWVVVSDPRQDSGEVIVASLTSVRPPKNQVDAFPQILSVGDHEWITVPTSIDPSFVMVVSSSKLAESTKHSGIEWQQRLSDQAANRVTHHVCTSEHIEEWSVYPVLSDQCCMCGLGPP